MDEFEQAVEELVVATGISRAQAQVTLDDVLRIYDTVKKEKENATMTNTIYDQKRDIDFNVGDWVHNTRTGNEGEILSLKTIAEVKLDKTGNVFVYETEELEPAERPKPKLTPEQTWAELPIRIAELIKEKSWPGWNFSKNNERAIYEADRTEIRHQAYILLGSAGVKVTEEVKERVRDTIERMAAVLGVRYL